MINVIKVEDAVGMTLAHDVTRVLPGSFKGPAFRRGHIIQREDIPELLKIGKEHVYILTLEKDEVHEDDAARRIARAVMGSHFEYSEPSEGRVNLKTIHAGLVKINIPAIEKINLLGDMIIATIHNNTVCKIGTTVAGMRIIPISIRESRMVKMEQIARKNTPVVDLAPFILSKVGLIITGSEVAKGRIEDKFSPVLQKKVEALGCTVNNRAIVTDDPEAIAAKIKEFQEKGSEVILCSSGMSVDPDDVTPEGIRRSGAEVRFYGLPVLPGAMFMYAKLGQTHIMGVPACVLHSPATAFDTLFPIIATGEELSFEGTRKLGHGGLCMNCAQCHYPVCPFCKE
jgi:molybdenum cofactor synthesis domain-containing protein